METRYRLTRPYYESRSRAREAGNDESGGKCGEARHGLNEALTLGDDWRYEVTNEGSQRSRLARCQTVIDSAIVRLR